MVVAAGNDGTDPGWADNPAIISVSATTSSESKASWSNYGSYIDVAAPGVDIVTASPNDAFPSSSGTSWAAAHVSGIAALLMPLR